MSRRPIFQLVRSRHRVQGGLIPNHLMTVGAGQSLSRHTYWKSRCRRRYDDEIEAVPKIWLAPRLRLTVRPLIKPKTNNASVSRRDLLRSR